MTLRILIADDHAVLRDGLKALIDSQQGMSVVGEAADGLAACEAVAELRPDVVVMDLSLPKLGGAEATKRIKSTHPEAKIIALTAHEDRGYVQLMLQAGASGYVLKRAAAEDLVRAIQAIAAGGIYIDPAIARYALADESRRGGALPAGGNLSDRETEVLKLMAQGYAPKEIAARLDVGARTVETYKARAMEKLQLKTRAEIVRYALQRGWLTSS
jgi:DNA-binding NarL/FixJ family response regulator